jgi:hypothetical protein
MSGDGSPTGAASAMHRTSQFSLLPHLAHKLMDLYLMIDRLAASTPTHSTQAFPTQVEHPEPPRTQQDRIKLVRGIYSNDPRLAYWAAATAASTGHLRTGAKCAGRKRCTGQAGLTERIVFLPGDLRASGQIRT